MFVVNAIAEKIARGTPRTWCRGASDPHMDTKNGSGNFVSRGKIAAHRRTKLNASARLFVVWTCLLNQPSKSGPLLTLPVHRCAPRRCGNHLSHHAHDRTPGADPAARVRSVGASGSPTPGGYPTARASENIVFRFCECQSSQGGRQQASLAIPNSWAVAHALLKAVVHNRFA